jgi:hypothetical protein
MLRAISLIVLILMVTGTLGTVLVWISEAITGVAGWITETIEKSKK